MRQFTFTISMWLVFLLATTLVAQNNTLDLRLVELNNQGQRTYHNFIYAHTFGPTLFEIFHCRLPLIKYQETGIGIGCQMITIGDFTSYGLFHYSWATDNDYLEPGIFTIDAKGKLTGSFWIVHYIPINKGVHQWLVDPLEAQYNIWRGVSLGASTYYWRPEGGHALIKIGPKVSLADLWGATEVRITYINNGDGMEFQLRRLFVF